LQTAPGWDALAGIARDPKGREVPFSVIFDAADAVSGPSPKLLLSLAGDSWREGAADEKGAASARPRMASTRAEVSSEAKANRL